MTLGAPTSVESTKRISFTPPFYDAAQVMVVRRPKMSGQQWIFLQPFTVGGWVLIVMACMWSGLVYFLLEYDKNEMDFKHGRRDHSWRHQFHDLNHALFLSAYTMVGSFRFRPQTTIGRVHRIWWSFFVLVISCVYIAVLSSLFTLDFLDIDVHTCDDLAR